MSRFGPKPIPVETRFWRHVVRTGGCWLWTGAKFTDGYGKIRLDRASKKYISAHRLSWQIAYGQVPQGLSVLHQCDTPACVRPDHLFLGTQTDNCMDMMEKGRDRHPRGEAHQGARLREQDVVQIRKIGREGILTSSETAAFYGITRDYAKALMSGLRWGALPTDRPGVGQEWA